MEFNSYLFVLVFFPITFVLYHLCHFIHNQVGKLFLIVASLVFLGYADIRFLYVIFAEIAVNYVIGMLIYKIKWSKLQSVMTAIGVIVNILYLGRVKYVYFLAESWNAWFHTQISVGEILIPIGISFISFQQIAFLVDIKKGRIENLRLTDYIFYVVYFPKLIQGPITKYQDLVPQITKRKISSEDISCGLWFFANGLAQKVLLADVFAKAVNWGYGQINNLTSLEAVLIMLFYTLQIYFDFNGYSHMAVGVSKLFGISLPNNFNAPYRATSVDDFWKRWHISLTDFLREYVYFPLGGSRKGKLRTYVNILIVFFVSGLWHGANWTFLAWGLIHGVFMCINRLWKIIFPDNNRNVLVNCIKWLFTFLYINVTWVVFRADSLEQAKLLVDRILSFDQFTVREEMIAFFHTADMKFLMSQFDWAKNLVTSFPHIEMTTFIVLSIIIVLTIKDKWQQFKPTLWRSVSAMFLFLWSVVSLSYVSEFIYQMF